MKSIASTLALVLALATGCSAASTPDETATDTNAVTSDACAAESAKLDASLATVPKDGTYDAVMQVKTDACGSTFHTAGPTHLDEHRLVRIGSMTKSFVSVVTLQLVAEGKIDLDAPISTYLTDLPASAQAATVRQVLQHTSGIFSYTETQEFWTALGENPDRAWSPSELVALGGNKPAYFAPGGGWHYSNTNFILAGMLVEKVDGQPIAQAIRERILTPHGLRETFLDGAEPVVGDLAPGFDKNGVDVTSEYDPSWAWAAGAMVASAPDLAKWVELLGSGALLPASLQTEMTTSGAPTGQPGLSYGLGVFLSDASITGGLGPGIGHGGDIMGYHSWGLNFPQKHTTIAGTVMSDQDTGNAILVAGITTLLTE